MKKYLLGFISGLITCGITGVLAANYLYHADEVSYDPKDTNWNVDSVDSAIKELYSKISDANSALFDLKNTDIAKAVGANGDTFSSVINKLGTITDHKNKSFTVNGTSSITIPAGYYNGQGTITTSGLIPTPTATKSITASGVYDVTNYASANVNVLSPTPVPMWRSVIRSLNNQRAVVQLSLNPNYWYIFVQDGCLRQVYTEGGHDAGAYIDTNGQVLYQEGSQSAANDMYISHYYVVIKGASYANIYTAYSRKHYMVHVTTGFQLPIKP